MKQLYFFTFLLWVLLFSITEAQVLPFPLDTLVSDEYFNNRAMVSYDINGYLHIVFTRQLGTDAATREIYYISNTSGQFTIMPITNNNVDDNYATLDFDNNNNIHICYEERDANGLFQVYYLNNIGGTFNSPIAITIDGLNKAVPYLAVNDSVAYFVYYTFTQGQDHILFKSYNYQTGSLSSEITLASGESSSENEAMIVTDSLGFVYIVFRDNNFANGNLRYFNNASGTLNEVSTGVTESINYPAVTVDNNDITHIVYRSNANNRLYTINDSSGTFSSPIAITPINSGLPSFYRNIAIDSVGRLYVIYQNSVNPAPKGFFLVYGQAGTFSDPQLVFEDSTGTYSTRWSSSVAARSNGEIAAVFSPGGIRNNQVIADIFMRRGFLFGPPRFPVISFSTDSLNFGNVIIDSSASLNLVITNIGDTTLVIDTLFTNDSVFTISANANIILSPDSSYNLTVTFTPVDWVMYNGILTIESNASNLPMTEIYLTGFGHNVLAVNSNSKPTYKWRLDQNYPNPFNPSTKIKFTISDLRFTILKVYDVLGNEVATLVNKIKEPGYYEVNFNASNLASGVYFYRLVAGSFVSTRKMLLLK